MTLIIGVKCSNGLVVGADAAATFGALGQPTIRQDTTKLEILHKCIIFGTSGPIGLGQRFKGELEAMWSGGKLSNKKPAEAMSLIRAEFWKHAEPEWKAASVTAQVIGAQRAMESAACWTMVGLPISKAPVLLHFNQQCSPEESTTKLPFVAIGSGQNIADPFLAFLWGLFWPNHTPVTVSHARLAIYWTLEHVIRTHPGGVGGAKQIVTLEKHDSDWIAQEVPEAQLREHAEAVGGAEGALRSWMYASPAGTAAELPPPKPTKAAGNVVAVEPAAPSPAPETRKET